MRAFLYTIIIALFSFAVIAQTPELVVDYNVGEDDTFDEWNYRGVQLGNSIIVPINSNDVGQEPAIIQNGTMQILKDIYPGSESSKPSDFFFYRDELYFVATDEVNGKAIWKTDGTEEGTVMFQNPGSSFSSPRFFTEASNGWLYYNYGEFVYRTDGTVQEEVFSGYGGFASLVAYQNGIILLTKNDDDSYSLIQIDDDTAVELARTEDAGFFADGFGLATVKNGIIFTIMDADIEEGTYLYNEADASLSTLTVDGFKQPARRTEKINDDLALCWFQEKGYYSINGVEGEEVLIHQSNNFAATQGEAIIHGVYEGNITFVPLNSGWASEEFLLRTDGSSLATNLFSLDNSLLSRMTVYGKYGFMADGISNGFDPNLYQVNLETGEVETLYDFDDRSLSIKSILPLGISDGHLYFINKLDQEIGAELFRIELAESVTSVVEQTAVFPRYEVVQIGNLFEVQSEKTSELSLSVFNKVGQRLQNMKVLTNQLFEISLPLGQYVMTFSVRDSSFSESVIIGQ